MMPDIDNDLGLPLKRPAGTVTLADSGPIEGPEAWTAFLIDGCDSTGFLRYNQPFPRLEHGEIEIDSWGMTLDGKTWVPQTA